MTETFGGTLRLYRLRSGFSQNALAKVVGINASYINRLESGDREAPTRDVAAALGRALSLAPEEIDRLMFFAGHLPPSLQKLGPADSTIGAVTRLLTNDRLSPEARADARAVIETLCIRWSDAVAFPGVVAGALRAVGARR
jgi:transcriptional regulator with XRE-family HTH domain